MSLGTIDVGTVLMTIFTLAIVVALVWMLFNYED